LREGNRLDIEIVVYCGLKRKGNAEITGL